MPVGIIGIPFGIIWNEIGLKRSSGSKQLNEVIFRNVVDGLNIVCDIILRPALEAFGIKQP